MEREIITLAEARARGLKRYFTGKPCIRGHIDERAVSKSTCISCKREEYARNAETYAKNYQQRYARDAERLKEYQKKYRQENQEKCRTRKQAYYAKNRDLLIEKMRARYAESRAGVAPRERKTAEARAAYQREYRQRNKDKLARYIRAYLESDPGRWAALRRARKAAVKRATPKWLSAAQKEATADVYRLSSRLTRETGIEHHVDHIVPLIGVAVCGLHVSWNLRAIPAKENLSKSNRLVDERI